MKLGLTLILLVLGTCGVVLSAYMTVIFVRVQRGEDVQCFDDVCPLVMKTSYAQSLGFPNSYLAVPFYLALVVVAALRLVMGHAGWLFIPVAVASGLSVLMSAYLAYALLVKLKRN